MEQQPLPAKKKKIIPFVVLAAVILGGGYYIFNKVSHSLHYQETDNAQIESNAIPVINRVAGYIDSISLIDYQTVQQNATAIIIDSQEYYITVLQAQADLSVANADYATTLAELSNAQSIIGNINANRNVAEANKQVQKTRNSKAKNDLQRDEALYNEGVITKRQLDDAKANYETNTKQLQANEQQINQVATLINGANAQIEKAKAAIQKAKAQIEVKKAALETAKLKLSYTKITFPITGRIGKINLKKGQYVQAGQNLFSIVDNERFWITANFKETQIEKLKAGQKVAIKIEGFPNKKITGVVTDLSDATGAKFALLPADNATGNFVKVTQRVPVKIEIDDAANLKGILKAGLSVKVEVKVN